MRVKLQLVICNDKGEEETVTDVLTLTKHHQRLEHLGLTLAESKPLLSTLQQHLLQQQVTTFLDTCSDCPDCGTPLVSVNSFLDTFGPKIKLQPPRHTVARVSPGRVLCIHAAQSARSHCIDAETRAAPGGGPPPYQRS